MSETDNSELEPQEQFAVLTQRTTAAAAALAIAEVKSNQAESDLRVFLAQRIGDTMLLKGRAIAVGVKKHDVWGYGPAAALSGDGPDEAFPPDEYIIHDVGMNSAVTIGTAEGANERRYRARANQLFAVTMEQVEAARAAGPAPAPIEN